jgi:hypothetical protein
VAPFFISIITFAQAPQKLNDVEIYEQVQNEVWNQVKNQVYQEIKNG